MTLELLNDICSLAKTSQRTTTLSPPGSHTVPNYPAVTPLVYSSLDTITMSEQYKGQDLMDIAKQAEQDLASDKLKHGAQDGGFGGKTVHGGSVSSKWPSSTSAGLV